MKILEPKEETSISKVEFDLVENHHKELQALIKTNKKLLALFEFCDVKGLVLAARPKHYIPLKDLQDAYLFITAILPLLVEVKIVRDQRDESAWMILKHSAPDGYVYKAFTEKAKAVRSYAVKHRPKLFLPQKKYPLIKEKCSHLIETNHANLANHAKKLDKEVNVQTDVQSVG